MIADTEGRHAQREQCAPLATLYHSVVLPESHIPTTHLTRCYIYFKLKMASLCEF
jgi:hypothetical protein